MSIHSLNITDFFHCVLVTVLLSCLKTFTLDTLLWIPNKTPDAIFLRLWSHMAKHCSACVCLCLCTSVCVCVYTQANSADLTPRLLSQAQVSQSEGVSVKAV